MDDSQTPAPYLEAQRTVAALADDLRRAAAAAANAQWAQLDPLSEPEHTASGVVDPEALLLLSLWVLTFDRSVEAAVHGWAAKWSDLLSVQRTRNIAKAFPAAVTPELHALAHTAYDVGKDFRWAPVLDRTAAGGRTIADDDAASAAGGLRLPSDRAALLVLRLRMAFGVGARADAIAFLLARDDAWSTVTTIAQATGYTPSAIRRALDRMAEAQIVLMQDDSTTRFRCAPAPWAGLLSLPVPMQPWCYWLQRFVFTATIVAWADEVAQRKLTAYAITEQLRQLGRDVHLTDDAEARRAWADAFADGTTLDDMAMAVQGVADALRLA